MLGLSTQLNPPGPFTSPPYTVGRRGGNLSEGSRAAINAFLYRTGALPLAPPPTACYLRRRSFGFGCCHRALLSGFGWRCCVLCA